MAGFGEGFLGNLGQGFRAAGAILSPAVDEQQAKERLSAQEGQQRQMLALQQMVAQAIQSGAQVDPQIQQRLGLGGIGPNPLVQAQVREHQANAAAREREQAAFSPESMARFMQPGTQAQAGSPGNDYEPATPAVPAGAPKFDMGGFSLHAALSGGAKGFESYRSHMASEETRKDALKAKIYDIELRMEDRSLSREQQERLQNNLIESRREFAQANDATKRLAIAMHRAGGAAKAPPGYRFSADGASLEKIPGGPADDRQLRADAVAEAKSKKADEPLQVMIDRIKAVEASIAANPEVVGGSGMFTRGKETVQGFMDPTTPTPASNYLSAMRDLQQSYRGLPGHNASRLKQDATQADDILQGVGVWSNPSKALGSLQTIRQGLEKQLGSRGGGTQEPSTPNAGPQAGAKDKSKSGKPMTFNGTQWVYD